MLFAWRRSVATEPLVRFMRSPCPLQLALLGTTEDPAGAEVVGGWYERNLKIYANIARAIEGPEERVLVIFGSGHLAQLASFFDQNPDYEWVSALEVLGR